MTKPDCRRACKYVYGQSRAAVHEKWVRLTQEAARGPVATSVPTVAEYLTRWLDEVVRPSLAPSTAIHYAMFVRLYIAPELGSKRLDRLGVRDVQTWVNRLPSPASAARRARTRLVLGPAAARLATAADRPSRPGPRGMPSRPCGPP